MRRRTHGENSGKSDAKGRPNSFCPEQTTKRHRVATSLSFNGERERDELLETEQSQTQAGVTPFSGAQSGTPPLFLAVTWPCTERDDELPRDGVISQVNQNCSPLGPTAATFCAAAIALSLRTVTAIIHKINCA